MGVECDIGPLNCTSFAKCEDIFGLVLEAFFRDMSDKRVRTTSVVQQGGEKKIFFFEHLPPSSDFPFLKK